MLRAQRSPRYAWIEEHQSDRAQREAFAEAVAAGLAAEPYSLPCRFFYDAAGSQLFEEICELPEYYLTRAEHEILARHAHEIAARCVTPLFLAEQTNSFFCTGNRLIKHAGQAKVMRSTKRKQA